ASLMVGRRVSLDQDKGESTTGEIALEVSDLRVVDAAGTRTLDGVSFEVRHGEVLAVAGVQGNGQTELTEALLGLQETVYGSAALEGKELVGRTTKQILDAGVGFVPEDRTHDALVADFTVAENLVL